ncbi:MAG: FHA domain-containing protein, partial [Victivallales bacterium]|nr:FHA domain-containing protein [Victivallales bacterium]
MSFSDRKRHIRLEYDRRTLYEINADDIQSDITIGRGQDNVWHLPAQDISAHRQHAVLKKLRRGGLVLESCQGREGLFYLGRPIKERRLQVGDVCGISDSTLIVEEIASEENNANRLLFHQLEQLTGEKKGKIYPIKNDFFSIGSAPGCDCQLQDSLVSQKHAIIELQADGTCRIKDNRSRNGTTVNGTPVHDSVGRMLKDGDIIAISYLEFKFWDKNVVHVRSHLILKLCAIIATLALVLGGYFAYQTIRPSAKAIRLRAEQYAAHTQFPMAEQLLKEAVEARGAEQDKTQRLDLERKLKLWQETLSDWLEMQEGILEGNESEDFILLCAKVAAKNAECWSWSTAEGLAQMKVAQDTNNLLVFTRSCEEALATSVTEEKYLLEQQGGLEIAIQRCREEHPPFRQELLSRAEDTDAEMRHTLGTYRDLQNLLLGYKNLAQTKELVDKIHRLSQQCDEHLAERNEEGRVASKMVQRRCEAYLEPLEMLLQSYDLLMANYDSLAKFDFASFRPSLPLPSQDSCKIASTLPDRRAEIETANANLERLL